MSAVNDERLAGLMEEIERAWMDDRDDSVVDRLAKEYPDLAERLYLFFAAVVDAQDEIGRDRPELAENARRTREWLEREGFARAARAAETRGVSTEATPTPASRVAEAATPSFVGLLRQLTGESPATLAAELDITPDFLVELSTNAVVVPIEAKHELARRAKIARGIEVDRTLASLESQAPLQRAASRSGAYSDARVTYEELVRRSQMSESQKRYWRDFATKRKSRPT